MKPGATTRPVASMTRVASPLMLPMATILPLRIPISPRYAGIRKPSTIVPFLINRSYSAMRALLFCEQVRDGTNVSPCPSLVDKRSAVNKGSTPPWAHHPPPTESVSLTEGLLYLQLG